MTTLTHAILDAPPEIEAIAASLGIVRTGYVPGRLYKLRINGIKTFSREKAEHNLDEISAICNGKTHIKTDIEGDHREAIRHPDRYGEAAVKAAEYQFLDCWSFFRKHFPDAKLFEWALTNATEPGRQADAEEFALAHLDGLLISVYWHPGSRRTSERRIAHANSLVAGTDKIVIAGIWDRYKIFHDEDDIIEYAPVPLAGIEAMLEVSLAADRVLLWSNTYSLLHKRNPRRLLTEVMNEVANPRQLADAQMLLVLALLRQQAEEQTP